MNEAQIHLALNHAPLFLSILGGGILILGMIKRNNLLKKLSLYFLVAAAIFTAPVFLTGEGTEELIEHLPAVNKTAIERHEEMAKISLIVIIITGAIALFGLILRKNAAIAKVVFITALVLSLASFGTLAQTAHLGGQIRHSELQNGSASVNDANENGEGEEEEGEKKPAENIVQPGAVETDSIQQKPGKKEEVKKPGDDD